MQNINNYGSYEQQEKSLIDAENDLLYRTMILSFTFAKDLDELGIDLFLKVLPKEQKVNILFEKQGPQMGTSYYNNMYALIMNWQDYGLSIDLLEKYGLILRKLIELDEKINYNIIPEDYKVISKNKIFMKEESMDWVRLVAEGIDKKEFYYYFNARFLEEKLLYSNQQIKKIGKI